MTNETLTGNTLNITTMPSGVCPNCGYCPHCQQTKAPYPYWPYYPMYPTYPQPTITYTDTTAK